MSRPTLSLKFPEPRQISVRVFEQLRHMIVKGEIREGQRIIETEVAQAFGVSRSPVREAIHMLASQGLVELLPYRGAKVSVINPSGVREHFEVKGMIEGFAAFIAAQRFGQEETAELALILADMLDRIQKMDVLGVQEANFAFHRAIVEGAGNSLLSQYHHSLSQNLRRYGTVALTQDRAVWESALAEHERILRAVKAGDGRLAEEESRRHAQNAMRRALAKTPPEKASFE